jgi:hypothetical protein
MVRNTRIGRFRRWMAALYASLKESSRISGVDWTGWRVD